MCRKTTCSTCSGTTWVGCGAHIPHVMERVPKKQWCRCPGRDGDAWCRCPGRDGEYPPGRKLCVIS
ncbi:hypothetical protein C7212DRAFT_350737 [Tuber magnatum]|uniref:Uncharacterized protein n=1 Tax=Tuber magnatum TaxID=42249 RepID=A0A317SSK6_9PEZI|nr:hypothetical protein C7212DRAFT_350737 [Tuber magnatum]